VLKGRLLELYDDRAPGPSIVVDAETALVEFGPVKENLQKRAGC
jgi:hypothetical protein